jgi:uncharacterized protein (DUF58 family)
VTATLAPGLLRAFLRKWRAAARRKLSGSQSGEFFSRFRGRGLEFEELRAYQPGDDVRDIAWTATARLGEPVVKVNRETRGRTVWILGDDSPRLDFGFGGVVDRDDPWAGRAKRRAWLEAMTFLSQAAFHSGDRVGVAVVGGQVRLEPPRRNPLRLAAALAELGESASADIDPWKVLERTARRRGTVVAVSDFMEADLLDRLARLARRHEMIAVQIVDPWERELPDVGLVRWRDAVTGRAVLVDTGDERFRNQFAAEAKRREEQTRRRLASLRIPRVAVRTDVEAFSALVAGWPSG